ncbi:cupin domain-containing protein [Pantoea sp. MBD-2R]|uniref:cupin domain-containing protein n=1 Tax=unclassified Pantoea TaxID=2630326 RepID=UPI0011BDFA5D|nr:cupin domain-containing protein [Pantoea sp. CCBC3-3-1]
MPKQNHHDAAKTQPQEIVSETLMQTGQAWNGTPYTAYPGGKPQLTVMKMHIPAHSALPWHSHSMPNIAYILSGKLTIEDQASGKTHQVRAGEALNEAVGDIHRGYTTDEPAELVIVYAGAEGLPLSVSLPGEPEEF